MYRYNGTFVVSPSFIFSAWFVQIYTSTGINRICEQNGDWLCIGDMYICGGTIKSV
jgi:hypothetical protein